MEILKNKIFIVPLLTGLAVQIYKFIHRWVRNGRPDFRLLFETGGMPSSHSASVMALTTLVGFREGFGSSIFGVTLFISLIIMYDAAGLRRSAGMQAAVINRLVEELEFNHRLRIERLKELLGHTPLEVFVGAFIGILAGIIFK